MQEKKVERLQEQRGEQKEFMKNVVQRVLGEFIDAGRLGKAELDTAAQEVLEKMEAKVRRGDERWMRGRDISSSRLPVY